MERLSKEYQRKLDFSSDKKDANDNNLENSSSFPIFSNLMQITPLTRLNQSNENSNINPDALSEISSKKDIKNNYYEKPELYTHKSTKKNPITKRSNFILRQELKSDTPESNAKCGIISNFIFMICCLLIEIPSCNLSKKIYRLYKM
jgi:hypothetical protein